MSRGFQAIRILHVIASANPEGGGPIEGVRQRGLVLREMGHDVEIASCDDPGSPWLNQIPLTVHAFGPGRSAYGYTPELRTWLRAHAATFDGVVVNGLWQYHSIAASKTMVELGRPYVVFTHGMLDPWFKQAYPLKHLKKSIYWRMIEHRVLRDAAHVLFTTEEERELARRSFTPYRANERVVHYGVGGAQGDAEKQTETFFSAFPELRGKRVLLFLSRIHPKKGCDLLIKGFADVSAHDPTLHLVIAGPDQVGWRKQLEQLAVTLNVSDRITWAGMVSGDLKWGAYHASECFVLPSHSENFGIVVAEAMSCARPVLITNKVNVWREVESAQAGIVTADTEAGVCSALQRWNQMTPVERLAMGNRALECFKNMFEINNSATSLLEVLRSVTLGSEQAKSKEQV